MPSFARSLRFARKKWFTVSTTSITSWSTNVWFSDAIYLPSFCGMHAGSLRWPSQQPYHQFQQSVLDLLIHSVCFLLLFRDERRLFMLEIRSIFPKLWNWRRVRHDCQLHFVEGPFSYWFLRRILPRLAEPIELLRPLFLEEFVIRERLFTFCHLWSVSEFNLS